MARLAALCVSCGSGSVKASVAVLVYRMGLNKQKVSKTFHVCEDCLDKWSQSQPKPKLRGAFRKALQSTYKAFEA